MHQETLKVSGDKQKAEIVRDIPDDLDDALNMMSPEAVFEIFVRQLRTDYRNNHRRTMTGKATITQCTDMLNALIQLPNADMEAIRILSANIAAARSLPKENRPTTCATLLERMDEFKQQWQD